MTREPGALMAETRLVVEHREHLWSLPNGSQPYRPKPMHRG